ncbi:hypothetical protein B0H16DRAFT_1464281 [Mycena metata]|uniref:Uncharacterized protein n=1 Tax=Mycena metata TaxID=1033252 RepID=A0AAD7N1S4_9AGAR|nr:hypothetical protein B0H16DRAFT_1464281 [Mycena metata]
MDEELINTAHLPPSDVPGQGLSPSPSPSPTRPDPNQGPTRAQGQAQNFSEPPTLGLGPGSTTPLFKSDSDCVGSKTKGSHLHISFPAVDAIQFRKVIKFATNVDPGGRRNGRSVLNDFAILPAILPFCRADWQQSANSTIDYQVMGPGLSPSPTRPGPDPEVGSGSRYFARPDPNITTTTEQFNAVRNVQLWGLLTSAETSAGNAEMPTARHLTGTAEGYKNDEPS